MVERQLPKLNVAGSIPVSRSSNQQDSEKSALEFGPDLVQFSTVDLNCLSHAPDL